MKFPKAYWLAYIGIFAVSLGLRISLAFVNRESNDNHMYPVRSIMLTNRLPTMENGGESYQPKLYHYTIARFARNFEISPWNKNGLSLLGQLVNCMAGLVVVYVAFVLITSLKANNETLKLLAFGLTALNPGLIAINSQSTNDTFVILFSTLAIFCCYLLVNKYNRSILLLALSIALACLAVASKTNGWVSVIAIVVTLCIKGFLDFSSRWRMWAYGAVFAVSVILLSAINPLTQYLYDYRHYGSPVLINMTPAAPPPFWGNGSFSKPGLQSIADGFLTFKFIALLQHPVTDTNWPTFSSFGTSLYGRAHSIQFDNWPSTWMNSSEGVLNLSRAIFIFALVPTIILLVGLVVEGAGLARSLVKRNIAEIERRDYGLFFLVFVGYVAFLMLYTYEYRTNNVMKAIFVLPALLGIAVLFLRGADALYQKWHARIRWVFITLEWAMVLLLFLYIADVTVLIIQLAHTPSPFL